jgi:hypothetical protein
MTKRTNRFIRVTAGKTALTLLFFSIFGTNVRAMRSDPENYYLDPEEIRPIVRDDVEGTVMLWKRAQGPKGVYGKIKKFDVRLLDGQIPLYTIDGEVAAYIYIAYVVPGPLPAIDEIITKAKKISDARDDSMRNRERTGASLREFYREHFPYANNCVFALYGVNEHCTSGIEKQGLPKIIYSLKKAEDAARDYYGSGDFEYVGFVFCSKKQGYEFTDGRRNIIVPTYWRSGIIYPEDIVTRDEVEANIDDYRVPVDWDRVDKWVERWVRKFKEHGIE